MNCKPGDLAVVVKSWAGNEGRIVRCVQYAGIIHWDVIGYQPSWEIDPPTLDDHGNLSYQCADMQLRPIRDNDGEDEMLRIAGKPEQLQESMLDWWKRMHA